MAEQRPNASPSPRLECRVCHTSISVPKAGTEGRFRCPKCLHEIFLKDGSAAVAVRGSSSAVGLSPESQGAAAGVTAGGAAPAAADRQRVRELELEVGRLRAERDALAARLDAATGALREAGALIARVADLEQRILDFGGRYVEATFRILDLERESVDLRRPVPGPQP